MVTREIIYRKASIQDNAQLLELTKKTGMKGQIALRTDREPDFFSLVKMRGPGEVFVALDGSTIVGSICVTREASRIDQQKQPLYYISDFKVSPSHRNRGIGFQLTQEVVRFLEDNDADFALLHVARGNKRPFVFFSERGDYPDFENIGTFTIYQFLGKKIKKLSPRYTFKELEPTEDILEFINSFYHDYQLSPCFTKTSLQRLRLIGLYEQGSLKAVAGIDSLDEVKQNVVLKMPVYLRIFREFMNSLGPLIGTIPLPGINQPIRMMYLKLLALDDINKDLTFAIIRKIQQEAYEKKYPFISFGLHEKDPLQKVIPSRWRITFRSTGMLVSMKRNEVSMARIKEGVPFKDFSTV